MLLDSSSEDEEEEKVWGGSRPGRAKNKNRDFLGAHQRFMTNYFSGNDSKYNEEDFEKRFRLPREVFLRIYEQVSGEDPFVQKQDMFGNPGISPIVRLVACLRKLAYGGPSDRDDENLEISKASIDKSYKIFCKIVKQKFSSQYLNRRPNPIELHRLQRINRGRGFPGLFASWDCKHFPWKLCLLLGRASFTTVRRINRAF